MAPQQDQDHSRPVSRPVDWKLIAIISLLFIAISVVCVWPWLIWCLRQVETLKTSRMSSDTASSLFSDRPIRPLPKRRLRERLSPEVADSIQYPPSPRVVAPLFQYPYPLRDEEADVTSTSRDRNSDAGIRTGRSGGGVDDDHQERRSGGGGRGSSGQTGRLARTPPAAEHGRHTASQLALSAASSVDGYDLLENTNNKKKRKIPTAGDAALNSIHIISDASTGGSAPLSGASPSADGRGETHSSISTPYYGSGSVASGSPNVPGSGRGRYGRLRSSRSPLRPLSDSTNNWAGRNGKVRSSQWTSGAENTGIISTAIANAEKLPQHGQENMSLLHQPTSTKRSPASTQFTFTCDSQVPGSLAWPGSDRRPTIPGVQQPTPGRPANENWQRGNHAVPTSQNSPLGPQAPDAVDKEGLPKNGTGAAAATQKTSRRSAAKEYAAAAKARRRETLLYNRRHPPKPEDIWICDFCEYEAIFGRPPEALIRQYEIADRKQRQLEQQRRAQWERMKKGKHKGKKHSKLPTKAANQAQDPHQAPGMHGGPANSTYSQGTQSEEGYGEEEGDYDDEDYDPDDEIPPLEGDLGDLVQPDQIPPPPSGDPSPHAEGGT